jgi:hypothetical protein
VAGGAVVFFLTKTIFDASVARDLTAVKMVLAGLLVPILGAVVAIATYMMVLLVLAASGIGNNWRLDSGISLAWLFVAILLYFPLFVLSAAYGQAIEGIE